MALPYSHHCDNLSTKPTTILNFKLFSRVTGFLLSCSLILHNLPQIILSKIIYSLIVSRTNTFLIFRCIFNSNHSEISLSHDYPMLRHLLSSKHAYFWMSYEIPLFLLCFLKIIPILHPMFHTQSKTKSFLLWSLQKQFE